jgi:ABC-type uncharacterized transport system permease subunit
MTDVQNRQTYLKAAAANSAAPNDTLNYFYALIAILIGTTMTLSFIIGVFVPQQLLGKTVQTIASFTPIYWYVKANNDIHNLIIFNSENLKPILSSMLIELGFAAAIFAVTLVIIKQKRLSNN